MARVASFAPERSEGANACLAGFIADSAGAYGPAFFTAGGIMVFGSSLVLLIKFTRKLLLRRQYA